MRLRHGLAASVSCCALLVATAAGAQTSPPLPAPGTPQPVASDATPETVTVTGSRRTNTLDQVNDTGSKLGLTPRETPGTVNIVNALTIRQRGYANVQEAVASAPGITVGGSPADPSSFSMRGFTGDQINLLRDGVYLGPSDMVNRPENSFNLKDIEVLQGPASVIYGQGAVGGVINVVTRQPTFTPTRWDALFTYGSFNTIDAGLAVNAPLSDTVAVNLAFSRTSSSGYVDHDDPDSLNVTGAMIWNIRPNLHLQTGIDVMVDHLPSYYGTPLIPSADVSDPISGLLSSSKGLSISDATRYKNYNTADSVHKSTTISPSALLTWEANSHITVTNQSTLYYAERRWQNAETYSYIPAGSGATDASGAPIPAGSIGRDRFYVYHQQHLYGDQAHVIVTHALFGLPNKFTVGIDGSYLQFLRSRGFPDATYADAVSLDAPVQGEFGNFPGLFPQAQSPTQIADLAGLFEDALDLTPRLKLVTGVRAEWLRLNRQNYNSAGVKNNATSFNETFDPTNFRVGLVYDIIPAATVYASYTTAQDPPGANIFLANAGQIHGLSSSSQEEVGLKSEFLNKRASATLALYNIDRSNILVSTSNNSVANVGSQNARGVEFEGDLRVSQDWVLSANAAYTDSHYGTFVDPNTLLDASGNRPPDVPKWSAGLFTTFSNVGGMPVDLGGDVRYIGERAGDYGNTLKLDSYTLVDLFATYRINKTIDVTGRINNLFDKTYVAWADVNYPGQVLLGRPRYFEADLHVGF